MKYFKPGLLARCRSLDDEAAEEADKEWEQALTDYRARIKAIRLRLPTGARRLLARYSLHDAKVLSLACGKRSPALNILLCLEGTSSQPGDWLELNYLVVAGEHGGMSVRKHPELSNTDSPSTEWILYDEFDINEERPFFTHSLLLTGGREIEIRFHNLRVRRLKRAVHLSPSGINTLDKTWPLVET